MKENVLFEEFKRFSKKNGIEEPKIMQIQFRPAYECTLANFEFHIAHDFLTGRVYVAEENKTYFWISDRGYFAIVLPDDTPGTVMKFTGDISFEDLYNKLDSKKFTDLFSKMYWEKENEIRSRRETRKEESTV